MLLSCSASELLVLLIALGDPMRGWLGGGKPSELLSAVVEGELRDAVVILPDGAGGHVGHRVKELLAAIQKMPEAALAWAEARKPNVTFSSALTGAADSVNQGAPTDYFNRLEKVLADIDRVDSSTANQMILSLTPQGCRPALARQPLDSRQVLTI